jgi:hypothetical protein
MQRYAQLSGDTGVVAFEYGPDSITIRFADGSLYLYTHESTGPAKITRMKRLAADGVGLTTFINQHVRQAYARKLG